MEKIDILLPDRLGDCILSIPAIVCLKQLIAKYSDKEYKVRLISSNALTSIFRALNLFEVHQLTSFLKLQSYFYNADRGICLYTSSKSMFYHAKTLYGEIYSYKKRIKFDVDMPYLDFNNFHKMMDKDFVDFMQNERGLATCAIRYFGICLESGFTKEQIMSTFLMPDLKIDEKFTDWTDEILDTDYYIFCMEAAYGTKNDSDRRWKPEIHFEIAEKVHEITKKNCVFIGIDKSVSLPEKPYFIDMRKKLSLPQTAKLIQKSAGYIGNDTGPLHIANLLRKKSITYYFRTASLIDYSPLYSDLNLKIVMPQVASDVLEHIDFITMD